MNLTRFCLDNPAAAIVGTLMVALGGLWALSALPLQLFPNIERPQLSVQTSWRAASPQEVESELLEPQERVLRGVTGLDEMQSFAGPGGSFVNLTFDLGTDMNKVALEVIARLNRLPPLPDDADPPSLIFGEQGSSGDTLGFFFIQQLPGTQGTTQDHIPFVQETVIPAIEALPGVASVIFDEGDRLEELRITFDPERLAQEEITIGDVARLVGQGADVTGGFAEVGRRVYTVRFRGRLDPEALGGLILEERAGRQIRLGDVAAIEVGRPPSYDFAFQNGNPALGIRVLRESGANVLDTLEVVRTEMWRLRDGPMAERGLTVAQSFDPSIFINSALTLLSGNLTVGVLLTVLVLYAFLRDWRSTTLISMAIPIALLGIFISLKGADRSINVISLAGLAFATGMALDAAIVVLENILRLRARGLDARTAALRGAQEVLPALMASSATTIAIFVPVVFLPNVEGQLFADLSLTIAIGVAISALLSVTLLPLAARHLLKDAPPSSLDHERAAERGWDRLARRIVALTDTPRRRAALIAVLVIVPVVGTLAMLPPLNYLPTVRRDAVDAFIQVPPSMAPGVARTEIAELLVERLQPYFTGEKEPRVKNYYVFMGSNGGNIGVRPARPEDMQRLVEVVNREVLSGIPDVVARGRQGSLFGGFGGEGAIAINIQSRDWAAITALTTPVERWVLDVLPDAQVFSEPGGSIPNPELEVMPRDRRIAELGLTRPQVGTMVRALGDGLYVGEFFDGERRIDIILKGQGFDSPAALAATPVVTPGGTVPLSELVQLQETVGPGSFQHRDARRTVSVIVSPPDGTSIQETLELLQREVEPRIRGLLPADGTIAYGGSADALKEALRNLGGNFLAALVLLFLLMAALFRSARDSALVCVALPLATVGGMAALQLLRLVSPQTTLDLLTMIGFIILLGLVVNNAILLVCQTRDAQARGLSCREAVEEALRLRLRPIFSSTMTNVVGMLPLVVVPGDGAQIYRGLAAAMAGGMIVSTVFTLILLPAMLRLGERRARGRPRLIVPEADNLNETPRKDVVHA